MITVKIEGRNVADIFRLKCVKSIRKDNHGQMEAAVAVGVDSRANLIIRRAYVGDELAVETPDDETCRIDEYPF